MVLTFAVSGILIAIVLAAKVIEIKTNRKTLVLRLISLGDERMRELSHRVADEYSHYKGRMDVALRHQLPLRARNFYYKTLSAVKEETQKRLGDIRGSKFLKKSDGISEFLKNLEEKDEEGRIDEHFSHPEKDN